MGANLKEVRLRMASVKSTTQITKAMKMVSAAKLRRATERIVQIRPYADQLNKVLQNIASNLGGEMNTSFATQRAVQKVLIVVITSDKGLAGGFNAKRIKWYITEGQQVQQGNDMGFIKFGSRVDLFLPLDATIEVQMDQMVKGNKTVIARLI